MDFLSKLSSYLIKCFLFFHVFRLLIGLFNNLRNRSFDSKTVQLPKRKQFTLKDVSAHCTANDCYMVIKDLVYDLTEFMREVHFYN